MLSLVVLPYLAGLVLSDLVLGVLLAVLALAVGATSLGNVDLKNMSSAHVRASIVCDPALAVANRSFHPACCLSSF